MLIARVGGSGAPTAARVVDRSRPPELLIV